MMINAIPPAFILMIGALFIPFFKGGFRNAYLVFLPLLGMANLLSLPQGNSWIFSYLEFQVGFVHLDKLSFLIGMAFHLVLLLAMIYSFHFKRNVEYVASFFYVGCGLGVVFACDFVSLFMFWECLSLSAVFLILADKSKRARGAAFRYLIMHVIGGLCLLLGLSSHVLAVGSTALMPISLSTWASYLIFIGFGVNAGWPLFHTWIKDAYPEATIGGTVLLSAITTKVAVYALIRVFPGADLLLWIGAVMVIFPIFFALMESDLRRVLSYSLISQLGYMMIGIGLGTELAINGAVAQLFTHIFYKALLFMAIGAVLYRVGSAKVQKLGGLYAAMPWTCAFCIIGSVSLSAVPFFSGFVSKSMIMEAVLHEHVTWLWPVLVASSAAAAVYVGIRVPFRVFFSKAPHLAVKEAPLNMRIAMAGAALICVALGLFPNYLYVWLPHAISYVPYTLDHILIQLQLLAFAALAVWFLYWLSCYPKEKEGRVADVDLLYRWVFSKAKQLSQCFLTSAQSIFHFLFVEGLAGSLCKYAVNLPAYIVNACLTLIWIVGGVEETNRIRYRFYINRAFKQNTISIGWPVVVTLIIFGWFVAF